MNRPGHGLAWPLWRRLIGAGQPRLVMSRLTLAGIAIAIATLLVTLSIIDGFANAYRDGLIRFNAPVLVLREDEQIDLAAVHAATAALAAETGHGKTAGAKRPARTAGERGRLHPALPVEGATLAPVTVAAGQDQTALSISTLNWMRDLWWWGNWRYSQWQWPAQDLPLVGPVLRWFNPRRVVREAPWPAALRRRMQRLRERLQYTASRGITATSPFLYREGLLLGDGTIRGVVLRGIDPAQSQYVHNMQLALNPPSQGFGLSRRSFAEAGVTSPPATNLAAALASPQSPDAALPILLGGALATQLGDAPHLFLPGVGAGQDTGTGRTIPVQVVGTFRSGLHEFDNQFAFVPLAVLQRLYRKPGVVTGVEIQIDHIDKAPWIADALRAHLGPDYTVRDWREANRETFEAVAMEKVLFGLVMGLLVLVAAVNIITTMLMRILLQYRSVAVMRALGLTPGQTQRVYFWQGMWVGAKGILAGLVLGSALAWIIGQFEWIAIAPEIYFLSKVPAHLTPATILGVGSFGLVLCAWAASRASRRINYLPILTALGRGYL